MSKPTITICAWCDPDKAATKALQALGHGVTHGICPAHEKEVLAKVGGPLTGTWRPIATAPKDGSRFIAYDPRCGLLFTMHWSDDCFLTDNERWSCRFTHWMPLPLAPEGVE